MVGGPGISVGIATELRAARPGIEPREDEFFPPSRPALWAHPDSCTMGTGSFPGVKCGRGVLLTLLMPRSWKSRVIPGPRRACNGITLPFTLMMEAAGFSYTSVNIFQTAWCRIPNTASLKCMLTRDSNTGYLRPWIWRLKFCNSLQTVHRYITEERHYQWCEDVVHFSMSVVL